jgi:hypothetical protein
VPFYRLSVLPFAKSSFASPCPIFAGAKIARNHGELKRYINFLLPTKQCATIIKTIRAYSAFADNRKFVKRSLASRFRRMFARNEQTSRAGRGALFRIINSTDKALNRQGFYSFCNFFL